jgi:hypothetical protein
MAHALGLGMRTKFIIERLYRRKELVTLLFITWCGGAALAQQASNSNTAPSSFQSADIGAINQGGSFGLGPLIGEPIGLGVKLWLSEKFALDGAAGWSFVDPDGFQLHGDFLFSPVDLFHGANSSMPFYFGVGGRVKFVEQGDNRAGIRGPIGISYLLNQQHLELFAEVAPVLDLSPKTTFEWNGGIGIRYYFH